MPEYARARVTLDEEAISRGIVDYSSVRVEVWHRVPKQVPGVLRELEEMPPHVDTTNLSYLERADGTVTIVPATMLEKLHKLRLADGATLYDRAVEDPEEYLDTVISPALVRAQEYAEELVRAHVEDFDEYPADTRAGWLIGTIRRVDKSAEAIEELGRYLTYAAPGKKTAVPR